METPTPQSLSESFKSIALILKFVLGQRITLSVGPIDASWMVLYEEHELKSLFYTLVTTLTWLVRREERREMLRITFKAEEHQAVVHITLRHLLVTAQEWERFTNRFQQYACYEHLRELRGTIEPLTWDEGHGQGVIVRLPWAT